MADYPQRMYVVRYPSGHRTRIRAHQIYRDATGISLRKEPDDKPENIVFAASHQAGVTITVIEDDTKETET